MVKLRPVRHFPKCRRSAEVPKGDWMNFLEQAQEDAMDVGSVLDRRKVD
jgi:hypothetical protein